MVQKACGVNTPEEITRGFKWDENKAEMSVFILVLLPSCLPSFSSHDKGFNMFDMI